MPVLSDCSTWAAHLLATKAAPSWKLPRVLTVPVATHGINPSGREDLVPNIGKHLIIAGKGGGHAPIYMQQQLPQLRQVSKADASIKNAVSQLKEC